MEQKLGRGLSALLGTMEDNKTQNKVENIGNDGIGLVNIDSIYPNENQPRKTFDGDKIKELSDSIKLHGVLQPIAVRKIGNTYEIVAGERRWRASKMAGLQEMPVHIVECEDNDIMALALIENIQRSDLNPIEESEAIKILITNCDCRQEDLSIMICKSRSYISNSLRLLSLPDRVKDLIKDGVLTAGHGKCLVGVQNAEEIAEIAAREQWTVRQLENAMKNLREGRSIEFEQIGKNAPSEKTNMEIYEDPDAALIAERIAKSLNVQAKLKITKKGGVLTLICNSCEGLENLTNKLLAINEGEC